MARHFQQIALVAASTLGSRVLGLLRDILMLSLLGTTPAAAAFLFAFTVPNLFRRLLGEGALTSALVPVFSETLSRNGKESAFRVANQTLTRATLILCVLTSIGLLLCGMAYFLFRSITIEWNSSTYDRIHLGILMSALLLPYMILVCLAAAQGAVLNVLQRFAVHALTSVWLNLAMLAALLAAGPLLGLGVKETAFMLIAGVLIGGLAQLVIPTVALRQEHWRWRWDISTSPQMTELRTLFLPAVAGAAILQVNILVSRLLGFGVSDEALPALYLASRLVELPLGVFAIAVATVLFPRLSLFVASGDAAGVAKSFGQGLRLVLAIMAPAAVGLAILAEPILSLLFEWGRFNAADVSVTKPVLIIFAAAMPCYAVSTLATRGYHAMKDTRTPVRVAAWSFCVNLGLSLALLVPLDVLGLALANLISSLVQCIMLVLGLRRDAPNILSDLRTPECVKIACASLGMGLLCWFGMTVLLHATGNSKIADLIQVVVLIPVCAAFYFFILWISRFTDREEALSLIVSIMRRR